MTCIRRVVVCLALAVGVLASGAICPAHSQEIEVDAPAAVLRGIPFTLTISAPALLNTTASVVRRATGEVVLDTVMEPLTTLDVRDIVIHSRDELPIEVSVGDATAEYTAPLIPAWFSILPPVIAIGLALLFHDVVVSLFAGIWLGCFFLSGYNPFSAILMTVEHYAAPALGDSDHVAIVIFTLLLGGMVGVISRMGGTRAIVEAVKPLATSRRRGQLAAWLAGLAIFFDDYANTLIVGNTMRPLTDKLKISREKLAYIVDSTAAPVAAIVFVSTWVGYEISLIGDGLQIAADQAAGNSALASQLASASPFDIFIRSIPHLFYPILAIFAVAFFIIQRRDFGPMHSAEVRAATGGGLYRPGAQLAADPDSELSGPPENAPLRWWNGVIPVLTVVVSVLIGLIYTGITSLGENESRTLRTIFGAADPFNTLLWGSLLGCIVGILLATTQRILSLAQSVAAWVSGVRAMVLAIIILVLAWSLGEVTVSLSTASFLTSVISERLPLAWLPTIVFVVSALTAFATGTSWGTMAILIPLIVPLAVSLGGNLDGGPETTALLGGIGSVLAGSLFGDHCSPISDTTVLSSTASGCDHVDHVRTQLPYALLVAVVAIALGSVPTALGLSPWLSLAMGSLALVLFIRFYGKPVDEGTEDLWVEYSAEHEAVES